MYSLVFFLLAIAAACKHGTKTISLIWQNERATAIAIPEHLIRDASALRAKHSVRVVLAGNSNKQGILGDFTMDGGVVLFQPLIPLSPGLSYEIWQDDKLIGSIAVPQSKAPAPKLEAIYPEQDTVPENLLKLYFHFSQPMRTGEALEHIYLLDKNKDTMRNVFLNLQPELWDKYSMILTLWLDPGRIKRDLVLNRELGNPLKKSQSYQLVVSGDWKGSRGLKLGKTYTKQFTASGRDGEIPNIDQWQLKIPKAGNTNSLIISMGEALDHYLLGEAITVLNDQGKTMDGYWGPAAKDTQWIFTPKLAWGPGHYQIQVSARLEDLAGNNLNRVFDRDIRKDTQQNKAFFVRGFEVGK